MEKTIAEKLHPNRFPNMSGKMAGLIGFIIGETWIEEPITSMIVTSDGYLLVSRSGEIGANNFIGAYGDFIDNLKRLMEIPEVGLTDDEKKSLVSLVREKVQSFSPLGAWN